MSAISSHTATPTPGSAPSTTARGLGLAGLLPFVLTAAALWWADPGHQAALALALQAYAAAIVSFLGGIHWGLAARQAASADARLWWGVTPSLVAWLALLLPQAYALPVLAAALLACYAVDARAYPRLGLAAWLPLRRGLTAIAVLACAAGTAALWV